jgi:uncharacterized membrane protein/cytochrome c2
MNLVDRILPGLTAYPDIHPMVVHLPVGLFPIALLLASVALWRNRSHLASPARLLLVLGTLGGFAALVTGLMAQQAMPHGRSTLVAVHRSYMLAVAVLALLLSGLALRRRGHPEGRDLRILVAGLVVLNTLLVLGADRGALVALRLRAGLDLSLPAVEGPPTLRPVTEAAGDSTRGRILYARLECATCHESGAMTEVPGIPPTLAYAGSRLQAGWIREYLVTPYRIRWAEQGVRPVVRMPDFELASDEAADLTAHLAARRDERRFAMSPVENPPLTELEAREGRDLIGQYACKGCHSIGGTGNAQGPVLDGVGERLRPEYVYAFLMDPDGIIPQTTMKDFALWREEARALTAYLMTLKRDGTPD